MAKITEVKEVEEKKKQQQQGKRSSSSLLSQGLIGLSWALLFFFCGSYLITETWTWGYRGKWTNLNTYIPVRKHKTLPISHCNNLYSCACSAQKGYLPKQNSCSLTELISLNPFTLPSSKVYSMI